MGGWIKMQGIPTKLAQRLCEEIRREKMRRWYTFKGLTCWKCYKLSRGSIKKMHLSRKPGNRGCALINLQYDHDRAKEHKKEHKKAK